VLVRAVPPAWTMVSVIGVSVPRLGGDTATPPVAGGDARLSGSW